ncbi:MAG: hypothetical protein IKF17_05915 [Clostridia bacterium]|nr:hypothetical protein [Clostridia bacterium]
MIILIATITIILYIIFITSTLHNLSSVANNKAKVLFILVGTIVILISTFIVFNISTAGVEYKNSDMLIKVRHMMLAVFIPVNGLIVMPYLANLLSKIGANEITQENFKKRAIIVVAVFCVVLIFECSYFKSTQIGIINIVNQN